MTRRVMDALGPTRVAGWWLSASGRPRNTKGERPKARFKTKDMSIMGKGSTRGQSVKQVEGQKVKKRIAQSGDSD